MSDSTIIFGRNPCLTAPQAMPVGEWLAAQNEADASLTALNDAVTYTVPVGAAQITFDVRGTAVLTVQPEGTINGTNWFSLQGFTIVGGIAGAITTYPQTYRLNVQGLVQIRMRCSAFTSGSVLVTGRWSTLVTPMQTNVIDSELPAAAALTDALANPTTPLVGAVMMDFNGSSVERYRHNESRAIYASAARTAAPASTDQVTYGGIGLMVTLVVSAVSAGTGGLTVIIEGKDNAGNYYPLLTGPLVTAVNTSTPLLLLLDPRITAVANSIAQRPLPRTWRIRVTHGDATSYTYAVSVDIVS